MLTPIVDPLQRTILRLRQRRWANVFVVLLRIFIGFAFVPAGLKKLLGQPFTDPGNTGVFHEFLHAFHASGYFYELVGILQLVAAVLLCSQRFATAGALVALPIFTAIMAFCWSTAVYPTAIVVTLIVSGLVGLLVWDFQKWRGVFAADDRHVTMEITPLAAVIDLSLWRNCGLGILAFYLGVCALSGGVYRPRSFEADNPAFYVFPALLVLPIVTFVIDQRRYQLRADPRDER
jgi:uncharacterized membrane protein YphA (DoxX/SURF4 family)